MEIFEDYSEALYIQGWFQARSDYEDYEPVTDELEFDEEIELYMAGYNDYLESIR